MRALLALLILLAPAALAGAECAAGACAGSYQDVRGDGSCDQAAPSRYEESGVVAEGEAAEVYLSWTCYRTDDEQAGHAGGRQTELRAHASDQDASVSWVSFESETESECSLAALGPTYVSQPCPVGPPGLPLLP